MVLEPFWDEYASLREGGLKADEAVYRALANLLAMDKFQPVVLMLSGAHDEKLSGELAFDGRAVRKGLTASGDRYWQCLRDQPVRSI